MSTKVAWILLAMLLAGCSRPRPEAEASPEPPLPAEAKPPEKGAQPAASPSGLTVRGHLGPANSAAFSPDGKRLATAGTDRTVQVWDVATGKSQLTLGGRGDYVNGVAFSPDGGTLAFDNEKHGEGPDIVLADAATGKELRTLRGHLAAVSRLAFSPDGKHLASASADQTVRIWEVATGKVEQTLRGHLGPVNSVSWNATGTLRVAGASWATPGPGQLRGEIRLWDVATGEGVRVLERPGWIYSVAFHPDGKQLAAACGEEVVVWDVETGKDVRALPRDPAWLASAFAAVAYSPDGRQLAGLYGNGAIRLWDAATGQPDNTFGPAAGMLTFAPDSKHLVSTGSDVVIWDTVRGKTVLTLSGPGRYDHAGAIQLLSPDAHLLASMPRLEQSPGGVLTVRDVATGKDSFTVSHGAQWIYNAAFARDAEYLATTAGANQKGDLKLWDGKTGKEVFAYSPPEGEPRLVAFSPDGKRLLTVIRRRNELEIELREMPGGKEIQTVRRRTLGGVIFHPDGRVLEWLSDGVRDVLTGKEVLPIRSRHPNGFSGAVFSRDGSRVATAEIPTTPGFGEARVWDVATAKELFSLQGHVDQVSCIDFSPDGKLLASGSHDKNVKVWDALTGKELRTYRGHRMSLLDLRFSPDGKRVVSVSVDGTVKSWDPTTGQ